ncbi:choice-of-anchor E domain-containing protein [Oxynema sp. CENA135]|uniref:choice-of-anchor E domain-containing protein n=1 Tax=Oxynema sp. CENA135 TaxID=984206 RepID=UPI00190AAAFC|nr:choice-of-anchor E domain-containing protein [Oxynema sp. CENA135]MBK4728313.1 choice-of-anchor E domain-containing protein [Oxynema sp. CENA135]
MFLQLSKLKILTLATGMVLLPSGIARASTLWTPVYETGFANRQTNGGENLFIEQFDPSLGILKTVKLDFSAALDGSWQVENLNETTPTDFMAFYTADLSFTGPDGLDLSSLASFVSFDESYTTSGLSAYDGTTEGDGTSGETFETAASNTTAIEIDAPSQAELAAIFVGTGQVDFTVETEDFSMAGGRGGGNMWSVFDTIASAGIKVSYEYEVDLPRKIPEPTSLLGLGLVSGLLVLRKRKTPVDPLLAKK